MSERYRYVIRSQSRISAARTGEILHHTPAHLVVPGATVRGALAALWWREADARGESHTQFRQLFDQGLRVGQAVPYEDAPRGRNSRLLSVSNYACKYRPSPSCAEFALDVAQELLAGRASDEPVCGECHGPTAVASGWQVSYRPTRTTRTRLTEDGTADDGNLFSREALPAGLTLAGLLTVPDSAAVDWVDGQAIRIGGKRSVMGAATITLDRHDPSPVHLGPRSLLRLCSPAVLVDRFGAATLAEADLHSELHRISQEPVTVVRSWTRSERVNGWHQRSALPKPTDWAFAPGTTVVVEGLTDAGWARLAGGIGLRTLEGYGELELVNTSAEGQSVADPAPADPIGAAVDQLAGSIATAGRSDGLRAAQDALRRVRQERAKTYGRPGQVMAEQRKKPWYRQLDADGQAAFEALLDDELVDHPQLLNRLGTAISQSGKRGGQR